MSDEAIREVLERYKIEGAITCASPLYQLAAHVVELERGMVEVVRNQFPVLASTMEIRQPVLAFAWEMEKRLRANEHKGGWDEMTTDWLFARMVEEVAELNRAIGLRSGITHEAADVANFAMMIADNLGGLIPPRKDG